MTLIPWVDIATSRIAGRAKVSQQLFEDFFQRGECLVSTPIQTLVEVIGTSSGTWGSSYQKRIWIPGGAETTYGYVQLVFHFQFAKTIADTTGQVRIRLYDISGTSWITSATLSPAVINVYENSTLTIPDADISPFYGSEVFLEIQSQRVAGTGTFRYKCVSAASRLEHHT